MLQADYDPTSDSFYSDLADDGWDAVPGRYNVMLVDREERPGLYRDFAHLRRELELEAAHGFSVSMSYDEALELAEDPRVLVVEPDFLAFASAGKPSTACASSTAQSTSTGVAFMGTAPTWPAPSRA